ncbi:hypothetical protein [Paenibacillus elgii]|uniref:hypothetical protein n=1 Tax=Paenibacillus elgii TaxID=189691 RepID=UPI0013D032D4|nr:hypothetical protein [Paenibacillus elgii]
MKKLVVNGLLALSLTAGIVSLPVDAPAKVHAADVQSTQAQVQPTEYYESIYFNYYQLRREHFWVPINDAKLTVPFTRNYNFYIKQWTTDNTNINAVRYQIVSETGGYSPVIDIEGNGKHDRTVTLTPGKYRVEARTYHNSPVEIIGELFPS